MLVETPETPVARRSPIACRFFLRRRPAILLKSNDPADTTPHDAQLLVGDCLISVLGSLPNGKFYGQPNVRNANHRLPLQSNLRPAFPSWHPLCYTASAAPRSDSSE